MNIYTEHCTKNLQTMTSSHLNFQSSILLLFLLLSLARRQPIALVMFRNTYFTIVRSSSSTGGLAFRLREGLSTHSTSANSTPLTTAPHLPTIALQASCGMRDQTEDQTKGAR